MKGRNKTMGVGFTYRFSYFRPPSMFLSHDVVSARHVIGTNSLEPLFFAARLSREAIAAVLTRHQVPSHRSASSSISHHSRWSDPRRFRSGTAVSFRRTTSTG